MIERFGVYLMSPDSPHGAAARPATGTPRAAGRLCVVVSPDELNRQLPTVIVAPLRTHRRRFPFRVDADFFGQPLQVALDQITAVDKTRLVERLGCLDAATAARVVDTLLDLFA